jgi:hypothetical protein
MMADDPKAAKKLAMEDLVTTIANLSDLEREFGPGSVTMSNSVDETPSSSAGAIDSFLVQLNLGYRGELTKNAAKNAATEWRKIRERYPRARINVGIFGYDQDPREVWEFPDARRFVHWFARFAGITPQEARLVSRDMGDVLVGFFAACGCKGFEHITVIDATGSPLKRTSAQ